MDFEEYKKEVDKNIRALFEKANLVEKKLLNNMIRTLNEKCEKEQMVVDFLKDAIATTNNLFIKNNDLYDAGKAEAYGEILSKLVDDVHEKDRFE